MKRRPTTVTHVGNITIGGDAPIRVQSMTTTNTNDTDACVAQALRIIAAGGELVRLTTQGRREAENMANIRAALSATLAPGASASGSTAAPLATVPSASPLGSGSVPGSSAAGLLAPVPLVADVHFNANVADIAARNCEKVRVNPGNYVDPARTFKKLEYTDAEYAAELQKIEERFVPFLNICKEHHTAIRIGVNHGSLSDRIMSRYGDTPEGIVESCMEFLRICKREQFTDVVLSIKASNTVVMVTSVRLLVKAMDAEDMHYPLHLGVTEAGEGEDGRIKSAVGIGALLTEGIGDTIRVSLSEEPECEIPVAKKLVSFIPECAAKREQAAPQPPKGEPLNVTAAEKEAAVPNASPLSSAPVPAPVPEASASGSAAGTCRIEDGTLFLYFSEDSLEDLQLKAAMTAGALLIDGKARELVIYNNGTLFDDSRPVSGEESQGSGLSLSILQAARVKFTKTEYISCPGCGRTLYDLQGTIARIKSAIKEATKTDPRFATLKIGIMGCIVNGPGEMADADYGYVGAGPNKISLYKGKVCVEKAIPETNAVEKLLEFIKEDL